MTDPQALAHLRDIHLPQAIGWWPPAPGWWILFVLSVITLVIAIGAIRTQYRAARAKKQALLLLDKYQKNYNASGNKQQAASEVSELLRRVALVYFPRNQVAGLQGEEWIDFLNHSAKKLDITALREGLLHLPYQPNNDNINLEPLFISAKNWIQQRGKPCLN